MVAVFVSDDGIRGSHNKTVIAQIFRTTGDGSPQLGGEFRSQWTTAQAYRAFGGGASMAVASSLPGKIIPPAMTGADGTSIQGQVL